jgi:hypothetical protein
VPFTSRARSNDSPGVLVCTRFAIGCGMTSALRRYAIPCAVVLIALGATRTSRGGDHVGEDVLNCEEAVAHLAECCPKFDASLVRCVHYESEGCDPDRSSNRYPALDVGQSRCVRAASCDVLRSNGVCARAQEQSAWTQPTVCP